jgi:transcriptional regulator with XRE-family HTH domain
MSTNKTANPPAIGRVIKTWRRRRKLTQKELAARTGLTPAAVSAFERGESVPKLADRKKICAALEVELRDFDAEVAWIEGEEMPEIASEAAVREKLDIEELSDSWDLLASLLKPWFLKLAQWIEREEAGERPKGGAALRGASRSLERSR